MIKKIIILVLVLINISAFAQHHKCSKSHTFAKNTSLHSDSLDVLHYTINLDITDFATHKIYGNAVLKITPLVGNVNNIALDLLQLQIDSILIDGVVTTYSYNDTLINISTLSALNSDDTVNVEVHYHGSPQTDVTGWGGFYFDNNYAYNLGVGFGADPHNYGRAWYPCLDDFVDRATYTFNIITPETKLAVCNGTLENEVDNGDGTKTFTWEMHNSIPTYLSSVAVSAYVAVRDTFNGSQGDIPIAIYVPSNLVANTHASFINLKPTLSAYESNFGPYMWERVGYVAVPFNSGAMEHATNIAYPQSTIDGSLSYETLYAHELSHHWFGDLVTCRTAEDMWLNEGWASYSESIFMENIYGYPSFRTNVKNNHKNVMRNAHVDDDGYRAVSGIPHAYTYGTTVYDKGADVANTLRTYLGDDLFFSGIQNYLNTFQYTDASSYDFRDNLSAFTGVDLTDFFDGWVFQEGFPHFSVDSFVVTNVGAGNYDVEVFMKQKKLTNPNFVNSNRIPVSFVKDDWTSIDTLVMFDGVTGSQIFTIPFNPIGVWCDKEGMVSDATLDDYKVVKTQTGISFDISEFSMIVGHISDSVLIRVEHNLVAADELVPAIPGLVISKEHYWRIDGDINGGFIAKAKFDYKAASQDSILMKNNNADSLVLLYRQDRAHDWEITYFTKTGVDMFGSLRKDTFQLGEYAFGIWDWDVYSEITSVSEIDVKNKLKIYPNPTNGHFSIENKGVDSVTIFDIKGRTIKTINNIENSSDTINVDISNQKDGVYFVKIFTQDGTKITKVVKK